MARNRSVDFLPELFKTETNKEFLSATLDQLTQEPKLKRTQGYIGRNFAEGNQDDEDTYIVEPNEERGNYQLEPAVIFQDSEGKVDEAITYPEIIDSLKTSGADVTRHDRLFSNKIYSWSPLIDFDKFVNHSQYYWLPEGPDSVDVSASEISLTDNYDVTRGTDSYEMSGISGENPTITVARGGEYTFTLNQGGNPFWIQTEPGKDGLRNDTDNISTRSVLGVTNNGLSTGTVTFAVPSASAQDFYTNLTSITDIDLATFKRFDEINGAVLSELKTIDGVSDLENKTIVFLDSTAGNSADLGWQYLDLFDDTGLEEDANDEVVYIDAQADRYSVYKIEYLTSGDSTVIKLNKIKGVNKHEKFLVTTGTTYSNISFYKNSSGYFEQIPVLTSGLDRLYYQDGNDDNKFGVINIVDSSVNPILYVDVDIVGKKNYTSPNGVVFTNGLKVQFRGNVSPTTYQDKEYYVEGVGKEIILVPVTDLVTPETYTNSITQPYDSQPFDTKSFDSSLNSPSDLDFITINRSSNDLNPWTRSNRWFHIDVITKTAEYNNTTLVVDNDYRANRPIIEFESNIRLFNYGTESKKPITAIDFTETDAFSNINGSSGFEIDGASITDGARVIFAADEDTDVRNKIYTVNIIDLDDDGSTEVELVETDSTILKDQIVVSLIGATRQGKSYHYDGSEWIESQQKTKVNQAPLFDLYDSNGVSYSNTTTYKNTTFAGTKIFSYKEGTGVKDTVLGFPLSYLNIDNIGDIVYSNNLYYDTFSYGVPTVTTTTENGFLRQYSDRTTYNKEFGWTEFIEEVRQPQVFTFDYDGVSLILDVTQKTNLSIPALKVFVDGTIVNKDNYTVTEGNGKTVIVFNDVDVYTVGTQIVVYIISDEASEVGFYHVPSNLENNPYNENAKEFTLGGIRKHYTKIAENLTKLSGVVLGSNNSRDLGDIEKYGDTIIQSSAPLPIAAKFLHSSELNFFQALQYSEHSYEKFKLQIIDWVEKNDVYDMSAAEILDAALEYINLGKSVSSPFHKSDMLPGVCTPTITNYTVSNVVTTTYNMNEIYDFTKANHSAVLVYLNDEILIKDYDYTVGESTPTITILKTIEFGDKIMIKEFESTVGSSYIPNTPSKLGLYTKKKPEKYTNNTYVNPVNVIQGHDGSLTVAYDDIRDDVLLEFETRIFNNIKTNSDIPISETDVIPGKFRTTDYSEAEINTILSNEFLNWVGWNRLDYKTQDYSSTNEWTWNYGSASSKLDGTSLKGHWRGIFTHYYDTDHPHLHPWEMLGLLEEPSWWEEEYGVAPYTSGNLVLWEDLEAGLIKEPGNNRVDERYKRTGLTKVIPVDSEGNLLNPFEGIVQNYNQVDFKKSWVFGDGGPVEAAWKKSSAYPFALQKLLALTKPAQYFTLFADRDLYTLDSTSNQYLYNSRDRLDVRNDIQVQTTSQPKHSYINWIADYHNSNGCSCVEISNELSDLDVRLVYRMASFTDKNYLKIYTDKSSPDSSNTGLLIPDQSYELFLHKNEPLTELEYSSVVIQTSADGYAVYGHSKTQQYFQIYKSIQDRNGIKVGDYVLPTRFTKQVTSVPYGYNFRTKGAVLDFLSSYGAFLEDKGMIFNTIENGVELNWNGMANEFLAWAGSDWGEGAIINLNPCALSLEFNKELLIVDNINNNPVDALDQNELPLTPNDYVVTRLDNSFKITTINNKSINLIRIKSVSYEHLLVLDNTSVFNDLVYEPVTGLRQQRLRLVGFSTYDWNGQLDAQGFILNQDNVSDWKANVFYSKGTIVKYKNSYWTSSTRLEPATTFNFNDWSKIDYDNIKKGLLPNIANKAEQITEYYNKKTTNLESDVDLLAMGLIGYRPREYMSSLDDVSRVNFYGGFIEGKGTTQSSNKFRNVKFDKKITDYEINENWAILESTYGASDNKVYYEVELENSKLQNNPSIVEVVSNTSTKTEKHQITKIEDLYDSSKTFSDTNILPIRTSKPTDVNLPSAGNVYANDVDVAVFELTDLNDSAGIVYLNSIEDGSNIWVAKYRTYDWTVLRAQTHGDIYSVTESDDRLTIVFYDDHEFVAGDNFVIQGMSLLVNGYYNVYEVTDSTTIVVNGSLSTSVINISADSDTVRADSTNYKTDHTFGNCFKLVPVRVGSESELSTSYFNNLANGSKVWIDSNSNGKYDTYEKKSGTWTSTREEIDEVNTSLINRVLIFDKNTDNKNIDLDYIDPVNGKILGQAKQNIDYITYSDPARYSSTDSTGIIWGEEHVGKIWWDVSNVRFLNTHFSDKSYSSKNWGKTFTGSTIDIRQWVKSSKSPENYDGEGTVVDTSSYTQISTVNSANTIVTNYYFWVTSSDELFDNKTLSTNSIKTFIENPTSTGVAYVGFLDRSTVALFNTRKYTEDGVLNISFNSLDTESAIYNEYSLIKENSEYDFLSDNLYKKLLDSLIGGNEIGLSVPNPELNISQKNGIKFRPRQSMFENRFQALKEYLTEVNTILAGEIISTNKSFVLLNKEQVQPGESSGKWDTKLDDLEELAYQDLDSVSVGHKYLVEVDTDNNGGWSIYEVISGPKTQLIEIQEYDTKNAWEYIDWYLDSDAEQATSIQTLTDSSKLTSLTVDDGEYVKVTSNSDGKFEIYKYENSTWVLVGLEDGTIKFKESLWNGISSQDNITVDTDIFTADTIINTADRGTGGIELRNVLKAINEDIFVDDLKIYKNKLLISVFNYILSEQSSVNWLQKTSFIDVTQRVRDLEQYSTYKKDDQTFLLNYIEESKPYHTQIKDFTLKYGGYDQYNVDAADFDCPVYYDTTFGKYISPILDYDGVVIKSDQSNFDDDGVGLKEVDYNIWELTPWDSWYNNRNLIIDSVEILNGGTGYTEAPTLTVTGGGATEQAKLTCRINPTGSIISVTVVSEGKGYTSVPTITLGNGAGQDAKLLPILKNDLVRTIKTTMNYNRCEYSHDVVDWVSNTTLRTTIDDTDVTADSGALTVDSYDNVYEANQLVRYQNKLYTHNVTRAFKTKFLLDDFTIVDSSTLSAADRTMGYYTPGVNDPGLNLAMLINGIDYPGVDLKDYTFTETGIYTVDSNLVTVDSNRLTADVNNAIQIDSNIKSSFTDLYLGIRPEDINVEGGEFIDEYSSHSPEELIPGSMFDTLDMIVRTRPGFDYQGNGHAYEVQSTSFEYNSSTNTSGSFEDVVAHPCQIKVINSSTKTSLHETVDYTVNWVNKTVTLFGPDVFDGNTIQIIVYEIGGGNQLYRSNYIGDEFGSELTIPVKSSEIYDIVIIHNGEKLGDVFTATSDGKITVDSTLETADSTALTADSSVTQTSTSTTITFQEYYGASDFISVTVFGYETNQKEYSLPTTTHFQKRGADTTEITADSTIITADNVSTNYDLGASVLVTGKNKENAIVELNGKRLRSPEAVRYTADGVETDFRLPTVGDIDHTLVTNSEIVVFVGNERQTLTTDYTVISVTVGLDTFKEVSFITAPSSGEIVDVYTTHSAEYTIDTSGILQIKSSVTVTGEDEIDVTTWNDTSQLDIITSIFVGPTTVSTPIIELFDSGGFDSVSFDFVGSSSSDINLFDLGRDVTTTQRVYVTLNGDYLTPDVDYSVEGQNILLAGELIGPTDEVIVTSITSNLVPDALSFRYFKDMNGNSAMYRISTCCLNRVELTRDLLETDDTIYVNDVSNIAIPNLTLGNFGIVMIEGERITFREIDTVNKTLSGLRRGTAGTGYVSKHLKGSQVTDISAQNLVDNTVIETTTLGSDQRESSFSYDKVWYAQGTSTASNGISLQNQTTVQANFVKQR